MAERRRHVNEEGVDAVEKAERGGKSVANMG
jgi:hypothetical protein